MAQDVNDTDLTVNDNREKRGLWYNILIILYRERGSFMKQRGEMRWRQVLSADKRYRNDWPDTQTV